MATPHPDEATACRQAGRYLCHLLGTQEGYRRCWEAKTDRISRRDVNRTAVARVLMAFLNDTGEASKEIDDERQLLDLVCRALNGAVLTPRTLEWFCRAFVIQDEHRRTLQSMLHSKTRSRGVPPVVIGTAIPMPGTGPPYRTVGLQDWHTIGPDGLPARHRTIHVVQALTDGLDRYCYRFDTSEAEVTAVRGARPGPMLPSGQPGLHQIDFIFDRPLHAGEIRSFEYITSFHYASSPPKVFRRACLRPVGSLDMLVEFHPDRIASAIKWAVWNDLEGSIADDRPVELDEELTAHVYHEYVDGAVVGFEWDFGQ